MEIEGTPHEVGKMRRMMMEGEAVTLIVKASELSEPSRNLLVERQGAARGRRRVLTRGGTGPS